MRKAIRSVAAGGCLAAAFIVVLHGGQSPLDQAFEKFLAAANPREAAAAAEKLLSAGIDFDSTLMRLQQGRPYSKDVQTGTIRWTNRTPDGREHNYSVIVPDDYDPSRTYPVRVQLHGGVMGRETNDRRDVARRLPGLAAEIEVYPTAYSKASWWNAIQVENLAAIVDRLKRTFNVDENRVYLTGVSDGGSGVYYIAMHDATTWSCFLPLNGHLMVLANTSLGVQGELYLGNLLNKPFFIINGGRDRLYPTSVVEPYIRHIQKLGVPVVYRPQPQAGHDTSWWPDEKEYFGAFVREHPRMPVPERLTWETERTDRFNRVHWLVVDELGPAEGESTFPDPNLLELGKDVDFGIRINSKIGRGNRLVDVLPGSNAEALGLRKGDVIVEIDGIGIGSARELVGQLQRHAMGSPLAFRVERDGKRQVLSGTFTPGVLDSPPQQVYTHTKASGRVDAIRSGNGVQVKTRGVRAYSLLLSPDHFDLSQPVRVVTNGRVSFEGMLKPDVATLLKWAARDNDRTMLFASELHVKVGVN